MVGLVTRGGMLTFSPRIPAPLNVFRRDRTTGNTEKEQAAEILNSIALLLELKGENPFKAHAYVNAARALENLPEPLGSTGKLAYYEELKAATPPRSIS